MSADSQLELLRFGVADGSATQVAEHTKLYASTVTPQWFMTYNLGEDTWRDESKLGWLFTEMLQHYDQYGVGPTQAWMENVINKSIELTDREKGRLTADIVKMCRKVRQSSQFESTLESVRQNFLREGLARTLSKAPQVIRENPSNALRVLLQDLASLQETTDVNPKAERPKYLGDFIYDSMSELMEEGNSMIRPFPWDSWNDTFGGKKSGEVAIFAGKYASGKSFICKEILFHAAESCSENEFVVCADLEMTQSQLFLRWAGRATGLPMTKIAKGQLTQTEEAVFQETMSILYESCKLRNNLLFLPGSECVTTRMIRNNIARFGQGRDVRELNVDYITLMRPSSGHLQSWEAIGQVVIELKELSMSLGIPVYSPIHLNKDDQTQFQVVDQRADVVYRLKPMRGKEPKPPAPGSGSWVGTPGIIEATATRNRSGASQVSAWLGIEFATATVRDAPGGRLVAF